VPGFGQTFVPGFGQGQCCQLGAQHRHGAEGLGRFGGKSSLPGGKQGGATFWCRLSELQFVIKLPSATNDDTYICLGDFTSVGN
jgi:hypothetical protein